MELDPDDIFRDEDEDPENDFIHQKEATKEMVVYLVDASPKMFTTMCPGAGEDKKDNSHFHVAVSCISQSLKTQIINRSYDEAAICFFNTREKKNLQDLNGVFVFNVGEREYLDRPTARLIKEFDEVEDSFKRLIGSQHGIVPGSRENSLYNALWAAQALLRKGSAKTTDKRILLFTNEDDPFGNIKGVTKLDMARTTMQRAKDAQDLGISIELLPLSSAASEFDMSHFYADLLGLEGDALAQFVPTVTDRFEDMKNQLRKRMFNKRRYRRITFSIIGGLSIELSAYALIRPTLPGTITWLDSDTNLPVKTERSFICGDTGALLQEPPKLFQPYRNQDVKILPEEISKIKRVSEGPLRLLGFKPLSCLKDYHNLRPTTFLYPSDEEVIGSTQIFVALHRSMLQLNRFAVAFYGSAAQPHLVALVAQDEIVTSSGQIEPPGMHMIRLPYSDDIRDIEEAHMDTSLTMPYASEDQIRKASAIMKRIDLKDFSVCQFSNPALQRHYSALQALALEEDEMPDVRDETLPDEQGMARPGVVNALEEFKLSVFGDSYDKEDDHVNEASRKRKASTDDAARESAKYDWQDLAVNGKLKDLTVPELKNYLTAHGLQVSGKKEVLISRILTHLGKVR
ncbi:ATP-dependent DNA helicase II subunit 1 [Dionaea muscipula]